MTIEGNQNPLARTEDALKSAIADYADAVMPDTENPAYRRELIALFRDEGSEFLIACIRKFASGQLKYGGNFFQADLPREARAEHIDLFCYNAGIARRAKYPAIVDLIEPSEGLGE